ncbi:MAG: helix-turn-helix domain-containing protein [Candidatus Omnitrophota bacterium]
MIHDKLLTIRDVARELNIAEKDVIDLAERGEITAYKIGGIYLRFKSEHIRAIKQKVSHVIQVGDKVSLVEKVRDFFYFNDFYILSLLVVIAMLIVIFRL